MPINAPLVQQDVYPLYEMYKSIATYWRLRPLCMRRSGSSLIPVACNDPNLTVARGPRTTWSPGNGDREGCRHGQHRVRRRWTPQASGEVVDKGLKKNAIGYLSNLVIGVASTAPAYSLAATLGFIVAVTGVGVHAPAVLLVSFVPMLLIAAPTSTSTAPTRTRAQPSRGRRERSALAPAGSTAGRSSSPTCS